MRNLERIERWELMRKCRETMGDSLGGVCAAQGSGQTLKILREVRVPLGTASTKMKNEHIPKLLAAVLVLVQL